jgi:hypothetical protein
MNNAGQLLAWYRQILALPDLPDRDKRAIDRFEDKWTEHPMFARAYTRIHVAFEEQKRLDEVAAEKLAAAESAVLALHRHALDIDTQLTEVRQTIAEHKRLLSAYRAEYLYGAGPRYIVIDDDDDLDDLSGWYVPVYYPTSIRRAELEARIIEEQRIIDELQGQASDLYREGRKVMAELKRKRSALEDVRDRELAIRQRLLRQFRWDPPAVNGVVTDEREHPPLGDAQAAPAVPVDPETQAAQRLSLARAYLAGGKEARARDILRELIDNWPETPAARQARDLLGN